MSLKTFKPYTKSTRGTVIVSKNNLWRGKPEKSHYIVEPRISHDPGGMIS